MSGKRQHFIPRFLQQGFASDATARRVRTYVYQKDKLPFESNIINVGVEGHFYTDGEDAQTDDLITDAEASFSMLVQMLRTMPPAPVSDPAIPEFVSHLGARTRHLRQNFLQTGDYLVRRLLDYVADDSFLSNCLERQLPSMLAKALDERGLPQTMLKPMINLSVSHIPNVVAEIKSFLPMIRDALSKTIREGAKSGHIKALKKFITLGTKHGQYAELNYAVVEVADRRLILGDSVLVLHVNSPKRYKTLLEKDDVLHAVYIPLGPNRLLVGSVNDCHTLPDDLSDAIAGCTLEYFIADEDSDANRQLQGQIGKFAELVTTAELEKIVAEIINEWIQET